ncbi:MAG: hypothetical protein ABIN89_19855 [Chitinophagaceae bacterium]
MLTIALIHSGKSFMPEITAYQSYFELMGMQATPLIHPSQTEMEVFDVLWFFMGIQKHLSKKNKKKIVVHEYCSASTPPYAKLKDLVKKIINPTPDLRISLAYKHRGTVFPIDNIPLITRRQGVHDCFFERVIYPKEYDFIYAGSALTSRKTDKWLQAFVLKFPSASFLLVGKHEPHVMKQFQSNTNIHFKRPVPIPSLRTLLATAHYAINYVPNAYPFNIQPSTKLLEYCAAGCNVISNRYRWVNEFSQNMNAGIYFIDDQFDNLSAKKLEQFNFATPDMLTYKWATVFEEMHLQKYLPGYPK